MTAWMPDGLFGRMSSTLAGFLPAPPPAGPTAADWADAGVVRALFEGHGRDVEVRTTVEVVTVRAPSTEALVEMMATLSGPVLPMRAAMEAAGTWAQARSAMVDTYGAANEARDGSYAAAVTYARSVVERN